MAAFDFKKEYKDLYLPGKAPTIIDVPLMRFIMVDGKGDPNTSAFYKQALEVLYGLSYSIKMSKMKDTQPEGYFDYVVPPLEGLWWFEGDFFDGNVIGRKDEFNWVMMIRQPEFVTQEVFEKAKVVLSMKKPELDTSIARLEEFTEGLCAQIMHIGPYDDEPPTVEALEKFIGAQGYKTEMSGLRQHHEIYLGDPRKTAPERLKTVIRHPVIKVPLWIEPENAIDTYIATQPAHIQSLLYQVRDTIRAVLPDAEERISWRMPTYWQGHNLIHFAAFKNHIGLYPGVEAVVHFADKLTEYKTSKGAIQLPYSKPLPLKLIAEIAKWCYETGNHP